MGQIFVHDSIRSFLNPLLCSTASHAPQLYPLLLFIATQEKLKAKIRTLDSIRAMQKTQNLV